ncbi:MAG: NAD(P)-binding domain-containing protein [Dehalococcoidales bacterium]|nr:NAD(P)-binding domain-containing protein [Dehalococcoidales bacterium]
MSRNILQAGHELMVNDARKEAAAALLEKGAAWADTPETLARECQLVVTCLPSPQIVEQVALGEKGLIKGWKKGDIYIDMSTNSPTTVRRIAEAAGPLGVEMLDAPVSGGTRGVDQGTLTIMVGGETGALEKARPVLEAMGKQFFIWAALAAEMPPNWSTI